MTTLQRSSLASLIRRLRHNRTSYRAISRTTGIPVSVVHAIATERIVIPSWIEKLASARNAEWRLIVRRRPRWRRI